VCRKVWDSDDERDEMIGQCTINFYNISRAQREVPNPKLLTLNPQS